MAAGAGPAVVAAGEDGPQSWLVAVDGSKQALVAFQTVLALRSPRDPVHVLHVADRKKTYLSFDQTASGVRSAYEVASTGRLPAALYRFELIYAEEGRKAKDLINSFVNARLDRYSILVLGAVGRKGWRPGHDIGSTTVTTVRGAHLPSLVVKLREPPAKGSLSLVSAVDGSDRANLGVKEAMRWMTEGDTLKIVHVRNMAAQPTSKGSFKASAIEDRYQAIADAAGEAVTFEMLDKQRGSQIADMVAAQGHDAHILTIGADGMTAYATGRRDHLAMGTVADHIVTRAKCNVMVTQQVSLSVK